MLNFEGNSESFMLRILWFCDEISNMLIEANDAWFVFDQNFDGFFTSEFDCFTRWHFRSRFIDELALLLRVF